MEMMCAISGLCSVKEEGGFPAPPVPPSANWNIIAGLEVEQPSWTIRWRMSEQQHKRTRVASDCEATVSALTTVNTFV